MDRPYDFIVIGGGILGASTAWQLKQREPGASILLLEKEPGFGRHQTGHNSGVIHAGVYYQPGSLKARFCRAGLRATIAFCREEEIPFEQCGKLIVATDDVERSRLAALFERCRLNGLDPQRLDGAELRRREPAVTGVEAIYVADTGITDFGRVCNRMLARFAAAGGESRTGTEVRGIVERDSGIEIETAGGRFYCNYLVCCAGLMSDRLARLQGIAPDFRIVPFRGEFYRLRAARRGLVRHLIYPVPDPRFPFVGVHVTRSVDGDIVIGPNAVLSLKREGYARGAFSPTDVLEMVRFTGFRRLAGRYWRQGITELRQSLSRAQYLRQVRRYCPSLEIADLLPHPAGIRAQAVSREGELVHDFLFAESPRSLHVCNAPSPAATSAIPIGRHIAGSVLARR